MRLRLEFIVLLALSLPACAGTDDYMTHASADSAVSAQGYPAKPVRIIDTFGMGGGPDLLARALAAKLSSLWGQQVTVENHPGAGATLGPQLVANSPADGYTVLINTSAQAYSAVLARRPGYDPLKDFIPVASLTRQPYVLVAGKAAAITTIRELIAAAKLRPGELKFGSTGAGSGTHLGLVKFNLEAGIRVVDVPPQPADAISDVLAATIEGRITYMLAPISITLGPIHDGKLLPLGVTSARRSALLPEVPTIAEAGVAGFEFPIWYGVWVRAGTSMRVVDKLAKDISRVLGDQELRDWIVAHGGEPMGMTRPEFARFVQRESEFAARLSRAAASNR